MPPQSPSLSVVIPAYNAAGHLHARMARLVEGLRAADGSAEVILVDDGSVDDTYRVAEELRDEFTDEKLAFRCLRLPQNAGKFAAIREGMLASEGAVCAFTDADLPYPVSTLLEMAREIAGGNADVAIGDRTLRGSEYVSQLTYSRRATTWAFRTLVNLTFNEELGDTQCGLKVFRGDAARKLFARSQEPGFAGDVEILCLALRSGLRVRRMPVKLEHGETSTVQPFSDGLRMLSRLAMIRLRFALSQYDLVAARPER